jgi:hypothetical protein
LLRHIDAIEARRVQPWPPQPRKTSKPRQQP